MEEHHDYIALDPNQLSANEWIAAYDDIVAHAVTSTDGVQLRELSDQCYGSHQPDHCSVISEMCDVAVNRLHLHRSF